MKVSNMMVSKMGLLIMKSCGSTYVSILAINWFNNHSRNSSTEPLPTPESPMLPYLFRFLKTCGSAQYLMISILLFYKDCRLILLIICGWLLLGLKKIK